ncbi:hypothetical protein B0H13DRAFT_2345947 [Mycena leptocephala]|nr:hypothetical protein B0H13DRAFT_2345947 [Mycena leptocephala]
MGQTFLTLGLASDNTGRKNRMARIGVALSHYPKDTYTTSSYEQGFNTELIAAKPHIQLRPVKYSGTPQFDAEGNQFIKYLPGQVRYVGPPSPEIDEAWHQLTKYRFFLLSAEAEAQWGLDYMYQLLE